MELHGRSSSVPHRRARSSGRQRQREWQCGWHWVGKPREKECTTTPGYRRTQAHPPGTYVIVHDRPSRRRGSEEGDAPFDVFRSFVPSTGAGIQKGVRNLRTFRNTAIFRICFGERFPGSRTQPSTIRRRNVSGCDLTPKYHLQYSACLFLVYPPPLPRLALCPDCII